MRKGNMLRRIFFLDTVFPHAASFTDFPSLNALSTEGRGVFTPLPSDARLHHGPAFTNHELGGSSK